MGLYKIPYTHKTLSECTELFQKESLESISNSKDIGLKYIVESTNNLINLIIELKDNEIAANGIITEEKYFKYKPLEAKEYKNAQYYLNNDIINNPNSIYSRIFRDITNGYTKTYLDSYSKLEKYSENNKNCIASMHFVFCKNELWNDSVKELLIKDVLIKSILGSCVLATVSTIFPDSTIKSIISNSSLAGLIGYGIKNLIYFIPEFKKVRSNQITIIDAICKRLSDNNNEGFKFFAEYHPLSFVHMDANYKRLNPFSKELVVRIIATKEIDYGV